ncbi:formimidoylglutamase [Pontixanthobacter aquaemixtae]|uniref:Formimidoylglutamase n=1 Tax=Pontixanthobacter aquaemixtae TaxID=1958940 RepID=A0A844ZSM9_9SPHN|nr:formimidoylglutamase [Pontixanthobacter aquaemixtae]MXO90883.1 formimidoylglutamase [Pontixanthobacter aquaemixtae]
MAVEFIPAAPWNGRSDPEDGADAVRLHHLIADDASRAVLGFASEAGVIRNKGRKGAAAGPASLRNALANMAAPSGAEPFSDLGNIVITDDDLEEGQAALSARISDALERHDRLVVLGGGHETAFGSYCGIAAQFVSKRIGIINLDAHLDLRLVGDNGPSSGTPFAQIRALRPEHFDYLCLGVAEESNTQALMNRAQEWGVAMVSDHALIADKHAADGAIREIISRSEIVYLTIDIDVLPHYQAPGVSAPAARGVDLSTIEHLVDHVLVTCRELDCPCPLADIVELSPPHDPQNVTAKSAALLARRLLFADL